MKQIKPIIIILLVIIFTISCKNSERTKAINYLQNVAELTNKTEKLPRKIDEYTIAEKVTINNIYKDVNGKEFYSFKIKPEQYLK